MAIQNPFDTSGKATKQTGLIANAQSSGSQTNLSASLSRRDPKEDLVNKFNAGTLDLNSADAQTLRDMLEGRTPQEASQAPVSGSPQTIDGVRPQGKPTGKSPQYNLPKPILVQTDANGNPTVGQGVTSQGKPAPFTPTDLGPIGSPTESWRQAIRDGVYDGSEIATGGPLLEKSYPRQPTDLGPLGYLPDGTIGHLPPTGAGAVPQTPGQIDFGPQFSGYYDGDAGLMSRDANGMFVNVEADRFNEADTYSLMNLVAFQSDPSNSMYNPSNAQAAEAILRQRGVIGGGIDAFNQVRQQQEQAEAERLRQRQEYIEQNAGNLPFGALIAGSEFDRQRPGLTDQQRRDPRNQAFFGDQFQSFFDQSRAQSYQGPGAFTPLPGDPSQLSPSVATPNQNSSGVGGPITPAQQIQQPGPQSGGSNLSAQNPGVGFPVAGQGQGAPLAGSNSSMSVRTQLNDLISEDSNYIKAARAGAMRQANSRGLINSSMAAGAGELAAIQSALPIAQADARTNAEFGLTDLNFRNNRTLQGDEFRFRGDQAALDRTQQSNLLDREIGASQTRLETELANRTQLQQMDNRLRESLLNTQIRADQDLTSLRAGLERESAAFLAQINDERQLLDITRGRNVSNQLTQINAANSLLNQINQVIASTEIPGEAKQGIIDAMQAQFRQFMDLAQSLEGVAVLEEGAGGI